jgi:hypothetical protein
MNKYEEDRINILKASAEARRSEVMHYQINIDNFRLAIAKIEAEHASNPAIVDFAEHLRGLLASSETEQLKERIMLEVIEQQLEGL